MSSGRKWEHWVRMQVLYKSLDAAPWPCSQRTWAQKRSQKEKPWGHWLCRTGFAAFPLCKLKLLVPALQSLPRDQAVFCVCVELTLLPALRGAEGADALVPLLFCRRRELHEQRPRLCPHLQGNTQRRSCLWMPARIWAVQEPEELHL